jgi:hypothetical protein
LTAEIGATVLFIIIDPLPLSRDYTAWVTINDEFGDNESVAAKAPNIREVRNG